ncbi:hypothetical protein, partial [Aneurinibacillus aneurinilyticus]|uniref:hypothetical protein n=1 Tax=Aneurinibacillus aneurinilyticus TaxID=1391 RepID=UPI001AE0088D
CSLVFFSQGRDTAALWRHTRKTKGTHTVRVTLFYPSMDTKGVDCPERKKATTTGHKFVS